MLTQSADTADDERNIFDWCPQSAPDDSAKSQRWRYDLASALGSLADIPQGVRHVRFTLGSRHWIRRPSCQLWAISGLMHRSKKRLFDHLVGQLLQLQGQIKVERLGCREVDNQIEFSWLLYRKARGLGSAQYLIH